MALALKGEYTERELDATLEHAAGADLGDRVCNTDEKRTPTGACPPAGTSNASATSKAAKRLCGGTNPRTHRHCTNLSGPEEAAKTGIDEIPCPTWNQTCLLPAPWGMYIKPNVSISEQLAGYKFLKYMTSPQEQIRAVNTVKNMTVATRPATLNYVIAHASKFQTPIEYLKAIQYSSQHIERTRSR